MSFQVLGQKPLERNWHVWIKLERGHRFKCVLCGLVTRRPTDTCGPLDREHYEPLTPEERAMCPPERRRATRIAEPADQ